MLPTPLLNRITLLKSANRIKKDATRSLSTSTDLMPLLSLQKVSYALPATSARRLGIHHLNASEQDISHNNINHNNINHKDKVAQVIVNNIDLTVMPNDKISIIGPNGAGKSTLVKLMLDLIKPTSGTIVRHHQLRLGYVPQKFAVPSILPLRVCDLLAQVKSPRQHPLTLPQRQLLYQHLSITPLLSRQVTHLSGGEMQRVLLTRALLNRPNLLILDEAMQGLDPESENWLYQFIDDLPDFLQCAMVVISHDLHWVMQGSRHVVCLNKHICCEGQPSELSVSAEFKRLFGHEFEQPYIHQPHGCQHTIVDDGSPIKHS